MLTKQLLGVVSLSLFFVAIVSAQTPTTCPALRVLTNDTFYFVHCDTELKEITNVQFNALRLKGAANAATHCTDGTPSIAGIGATAVLRWSTTSGFPEACDVFTIRDKEDVDEAVSLRVAFSDLYESEEFFVAEDALVWSGATLICIDPPITDLTVETCP